MPKRKAVDHPPPRGREEVCRALIEAGTRLFAKHGPDAVSVRDVAAEARVNHSLVFRHFGNKDALVRAIFESMFENSGSKDQNITSARDRLQASVAALTTNKDLWRLLTYAMLEGKTPVLPDGRLDEPLALRAVDDVGGHLQDLALGPDGTNAILGIVELGRRARGNDHGTGASARPRQRASRPGRALCRIQRPPCLPTT